MAFRIVETTVSDKSEALAPLVAAHRDEVERMKPMRMADPDWDLLRVYEEAGVLFSLIAYDGEEIAGYSVNVIGPSSHHRGIDYCQNEALYVDPKHRGSPLGVRLINATESIATQRGATVVVWPAKTGTMLAEILPRMGYAVDDMVFAKELHHGMG